MVAVALVAVRPHARLPLVDNALRDFRLELGIAAGLVAFFFIVVAFAVSSLEDWARIAALVAEGAVLFLGLARFPGHPAASFVSAGLAAFVLGLLMTDNAWKRPHPTPERLSGTTRRRLTDAGRGGSRGEAAGSPAFLAD